MADVSQRERERERRRRERERRQTRTPHNPYEKDFGVPEVSDLKITAPSMNFPFSVPN